jgi:predicted O-methyltransferase YrrM
MEHIYKQPQYGEAWFNYQKVYDLMIDFVPDGGRIVEVGSWKGSSASYLAVEIINKQRKISVDCVDLWHGLAKDYCVGAGNMPLYETFLKNTEQFRHIITPYQGKSVEMAKNYAYNSLDCVNLDAAHDYKSVIEDLEAWYPRVKNGGVIMGHDIDWDGVFNAVGDFFFRQDKPGKVIPMEHCWIYFKGQPI